MLAAQARRDLLGTALGIVVFDAPVWATTLSIAIVVAGLAMIGLGVLLVARWPETRFAPVDVGSRWAESGATLRRGVAVVRADRLILLVLIATLFVNGAAEGFGRLFQRRVVLLGLPKDPDPIVWFAAIALLAAALGAMTLRIVEARIDGNGVARRVYVAAWAVGVAGLLVFAHAPNAASAVAGSLLVSGIAFPITRLGGTILVNRARRATCARRSTRSCRKRRTLARSSSASRSRSSPGRPPRRSR